MVFEVYSSISYWRGRITILYKYMRQALESVLAELHTAFRDQDLIIYLSW